MKKRGSKARSQKSHFKRRALERFGVRMSDRQMDEIIRLIQAGKVPFVERQSVRVTIWEATLPDGSKAKVAYDAHRKTIVTAMPVEWK